MTTNGLDVNVEQIPFQHVEQGGAIHLVIGRAGEAVVLSPDLVGALNDALERLAHSDKPVVLRSVGDGFCHGMDISTLVDWPADQSTRPIHENFARLLKRLQNHSSLTIAIVEGDAMGGGAALAASCDFVVANAGARFALPEMVWGLLPANAAPVMVGRMGVAAARRLALSTEPIASEIAAQQGLVDFVADTSAKVDGIVRRLIVRALRQRKGAISSMRELFEVLQHNPQTYDAYALDQITAITDDPDFRQQAAHALAQLNKG